MSSSNEVKIQSCESGEAEGDGESFRVVHER
jgi:hypothetical protein